MLWFDVALAALGSRQSCALRVTCASPILPLWDDALQPYNYYSMPLLYDSNTPLDALVTPCPRHNLVFYTLNDVNGDLQLVTVEYSQTKKSAHIYPGIETNHKHRK